MQDPVLVEDHRLERRIIGEHGDHNIAARGCLARTLRDAGTACCKLLRAGACAVVDNQFMAGLEQLSGHRCTHSAKPNKPNSH